MLIRLIDFFKKIYISWFRIKTPIILQFSDTECGIAVIAIIFAYYKLHISLDELREKCGASRDGCKAGTLLQVARLYGFNAEAFTVDIDIIKKLSEPVIAYWNFNHYVVINGFRKNKFFINDPSCGEVVLTYEEFDKAFTGVIIHLSPIQQIIQKKPRSVFILFVRQMLMRFHRELIFMVVCLLAISICSLLTSNLSTIFIDYCVILNNKSWIPYVMLFSLAVAIVFSGSNLLQKKSQFKLCAKASLLESSKIILHILKLPLIFYSLRQKTEIISALLGMEAIVSSILKNLMAIKINIFSAFVCLFVMIKIDILLSILSVLLFIFSSLIFFYLSKINLSYEKRNICAAGKWQAYAISSVRNFETIKSCGLEQYVAKKWKNLFYSKISIQDKLNVLSIFRNVVSKTHHELGMLFILGLGSVRVNEGLISIGHLVVYYAIHLFFSGNFSAIFQALKEVQYAQAYHARINDLLVYSKDHRFNYSDEYEDLNFTLQAPTIFCDQVSFCYSKMSAPILKNIHMEIQPGQHIALVGSSGSGKSTLAKILCSLYQPSLGKIWVDEKEIVSLSAHALSCYFSYVSQDVNLLSGTIYENITMYKKSVPLAMINRAIQISCLEELIIARGLHGKVEENGRNFSGGEKQRIDIARALLQNSSIMVMDEATSALDIETEKKLINYLRVEDRTIIFVAHRLSTIQHCDQIFVLENGEIIECGTHLQLISKNGHYCRLIEYEQSHEK